jgi:TolB-like protein/tetratricopeptide (TPR) repeat protein
VTESAKAVFLSYASEDSAAAARLAGCLRAGGIEVWLDTSELRSGDAWDQKIRKQIRDCALFLPIISATTQERDEGYFRREWRQAVDRSHDMATRTAFLVPIVIDDTNERSAEVPDEFLKIQWTRLPNGQATAAFVERLHALLEAKSARTDSLHPGILPSVVLPAAPPPAKPIEQGKRRIALLALFAAALVLGGFGWQQFKRHETENSQLVSTAASSATSPAPAAAEQSVVVLPFVNESSDKEQEYFADGLTDTMIDLLSQVRNLRVPARSSSFFFKDKNEELSAIAAKLHVTHVLEGTVRKAGGRLRVSAELIRADTGDRAWSQVYDRDSKDIFKVQDEISTAVVAALKLKLVSAATNSKVRGTSNPEAYNRFLIGRHFMTELPTTDYYRRASLALRESLALDPAYADANALLVLADAYLAESTGDAAGLTRAIADGERLPLSHPDHGPSYRIRGAIRDSFEWNWSGAQADYERALELDPADGDAYYDESLTLQSRGRFREAIEAAQKAAALEPLDLSNLGILAQAQLALRDFEGAEQTVKRIAGIDPRSEWRPLALSQMLLLQGRYGESLATCPNIPTDRRRLVCTAQAQFSLGHHAEANQALADLRKIDIGGNLVNVADVYAWFGDADQAFAVLDHAVAARESDLASILGRRSMDSLHIDPRWNALLKKINLL